MAKAVKCDRCGNFYEYKHDNYSDSVYVNGIILADFDINGKYYSRKSKELCPPCVTSLVDWLGDWKPEDA